MQTAHSLQKSWQEVLKNDNIGIQISCLSKLETKEIYIMYVSFFTKTYITEAFSKIISKSWFSFN